MMEKKKENLDRENFRSKFGKEIFERYFGMYISKDNPVSEGDIPENGKNINGSSEKKINEKITIHDSKNYTEKSTEKPIRKEKFRKDLFIEDLIEEDHGNDNSNSDNKFIGLTPYTITQYLINTGIVGEEGMGALAAIAIASNMHILVEGSSGSGKTYIMDNILKLFPKKEIYKLGLSSGQAVWHETDKINGKSIIYIPEMQKAMSGRGGKSLDVIELVKNLTEGKDASRIVTNTNRKGTEEYVVECGKTIISTIAKENDFKYDRETQRRFLILETDSSEKHIEDIISSKISKKVNVDVSDHKTIVEKRLSDRIEYVRERKDLYVLNPFIGYLKNSFPVTEKTQSYLDHYLNLFDAYGRFFEAERSKLNIGGKDFVMLNLEDVYNVFSMYHGHFINTLQSFNSEYVLEKFFPDWNECMRRGIATAYEDLSITLPDRTIKIGKEHPELLNEWLESQVNGTKVYTTDYKTGERKEIADISICTITDERRLLPEAGNDTTQRIV